MSPKFSFCAAGLAFLRIFRCKSKDAGFTSICRLDVCLAALLALGCNTALAHEFHVATNGDDLADGSSGHPFATIWRAQDAVRKYNSALADSKPTFVIIHGGTYFIDAPIVLKPEDSGTDEAPVIYEAASGVRAPS